MMGYYAWLVSLAYPASVVHATVASGISTGTVSGIIGGEAPPFIVLAVLAAMIGVVAAQLVYTDRHGLSRQFVAGKLTALRYSLLVIVLYLAAQLLQMVNIVLGRHILDWLVMGMLFTGCGVVFPWVLWIFEYAGESIPRPVEDDLDIIRRFVERVLRH
jgi:hypothetical protein